jgi:hypothetical protein
MYFYRYLTLLLTEVLVFFLIKQKDGRIHSRPVKRDELTHSGGPVLFRSAKMDANIEMYGARFGRIVPERKVEMAVMMKGRKHSANTVWYVGLVTLVLLVIGGAGMTRACKLIDRFFV